MSWMDAVDDGLKDGAALCKQSLPEIDGVFAGMMERTDELRVQQQQLGALMGGGSQQLIGPVGNDVRRMVSTTGPAGDAIAMGPAISGMGKITFTIPDLGPGESIRIPLGSDGAPILGADMVVLPAKPTSRTRKPRFQISRACARFWAYLWADRGVYLALALFGAVKWLL